jgi:hypothetical protein
MQTRTDLYETLGYFEYEKKLDQLFGTPEDDDTRGTKQS